MELQISAQSIETGSRNSARCMVDGGLTLGRGPDSPLPLDGIGISREHLRLHAEGDRIFITDLSSNGTWVNDQRLARGNARPLAFADAIRIPGFEIRIEPQGEPPAAAPAARPPVSRRLPVAFSKIETLLILLALATFALVALYWTQTGD